MDELYDNLENYEDLHIVEKLKNENLELKTKLEEYSIAMEKLQKDFDKVSTDFKKLELNYSSLLKTAKVEIERKTKIINDLNIEKDMIILKALQNKDVRRFREITTNPFQKGPKIDTDLGKKTINPDNLKVKCDSGRKEDNRFSSVDTVTSCNTDVTNRLLKLANCNAESTEQWSDRTSDTKENTKKDVQDSSSSKTRALSIRNRRKSMPAVRSQVKFSSDEEGDDNYFEDQPYPKCFPSREDDNRQNADKVQNKMFHDRYRHKGLEERNKVSETSSVDDRYPSYEPNRDTYHRTRSDKYVVDKFRGRDRYDNQRHRRYLSPERLRRPHRSEYQRQDYGRHRVLESPPPDKFHHYQQRNRESRPKHDRVDPFDFERKDRQPENPSKHKISNEPFEEPASKRPRTDSFNKYPEEEKKWTKGVPLEKSLSDLFEQMPQYTTCQSPDDYLMSDDSSPHPVKEIMNTASTPLEDPRTHSNKYILKTVDNNPILSTITGRNVDLKPVDLNKWGVNPIHIPKALTRRPSQCSEEIIKEVYMDIENPVSNMSAESGELLSTEDEPDKIDHKTIGLPKSIRHDLEDRNIDCSKFSNFAEADKDNNKSLLKSTYRIPKIKNSNEDKPILSDLRAIIDSKKSSNKIDHQPSAERKDSKIIKSDNATDKAALRDSKNRAGKSSIKHEQRKKDSIATAKALVEGDLELSDETSEYTEIQGKAPKIDQTVSNTTNFKNVTSEKCNTVMSSIVFKPNKLDPVTTEKEISHTKCKDNEQNKKQEENKKHRGKKKTSKNKETAKADKIEQIPDNKEKTRKDKKTKFSELFGDSNSVLTQDDAGSNSLISPYDLGIATGLTESTSKYVPILCENAQDAVDVNVSEAAKLKTSLSQEASISANDIKDLKDQTSTTESKSKSYPKTVNETKKKKSRNSASELPPEEAKPQISKSNRDLIALTTEEQPALISPIELVPDTIPKASIVDRNEKDVKINKNLHRPDLSLKALATSTPQKVSQPEGSDIRPVPGSEPVNKASSPVCSADNTADSSHDTPAPAIDVPDVRIFVKRRRRAVKKPA